MFHSIFSKLKRKNSKPVVKPKIIADIHEKDSMIFSELKSSQEIELEIQSLKIGDYLIGGTIIERKTTDDFISSMLSKRLINQLKQMNQYKQRLLILEENLGELTSGSGGGWRAGDSLNPNAIRGFILSIITNWQTPIIFTLNSKDTSSYLITLAKQQLKPRIKSSLHSRIPKTLKEQKQYILESFPNIGPKKAELLIKKFKNLKKIFNADEEELKEVLKNKSKDFKDILDY